MKNNIDENEMIIRVFRKRKLIQWSMVVPVVIFFFGYNLVEKQGAQQLFGLPKEILLYPFMLYFMTAVFFTYINWRCPSCNRFIGLAFNPVICPKCGARLKKQ